MDSNRLRLTCAALALVALLGACTKKEDVANHDVTAQAVGTDTDLPKECVEAEQAHRACTETMAANIERAGQPDAAQRLRDALPKEMEGVRARWRANPNRDGLAQSCAATRDALRAQPQCRQ
ncbi:hypothetical protein LMG7141_02452 [Ralstonia condita]|uniref:Lipoprotein n=1 Tax=Ralstonia condita TaxID=3058600 RepID=A0ABM9JE26_9RALS|nr:hypothetical protein [Burkholderiaceae bacterium]CAJ0791026.1 hypothetical protein LMG7141_02452 [Ralstonia sp. LMG 7141]